MDIPTEYNLRRYERYETVGSVAFQRGQLQEEIVV